MDDAIEAPADVPARMSPDVGSILPAKLAGSRFVGGWSLALLVAGCDRSSESVAICFTVSKASLKLEGKGCSGARR